MRHPFLSVAFSTLLAICLIIPILAGVYGVPEISQAFDVKISIGFVGICALVAAIAYSADMHFVNGVPGYRLLFVLAIVTLGLWTLGMFVWSSQNPMIGVFVFFAAFALIVTAAASLWHNRVSIFGAGNLKTNPAAG